MPLMPHIAARDYARRRPRAIRARRRAARVYTRAQPVRLLFAANVPPDPTLGAAYCDLALIRALRDRGHHVDEIWEAASPRRIRHGNLHQLLELPRAYARAVEARCRATAYDVIQVSQPHAYLAARRHRRAGRSGLFVNRSHGWEPRVREVLRASGEARLDRRGSWRRWASEVLWLLLRRHNARVLEEADGLVVGSGADRDYVLRSAALDRERVGVLHPGVDPGFLAPPAAFTPERAQRLLYVGQFAPFKAPEIVAAVASRLLAAEPARAMTWVCQARYHEAARSLLDGAVRQRVTFEGWLDRRALMELMDRHGLLLFPSRFEGFGQVFLEAMARGLCVVATAVGGVPEVIRDGHDGRFVAAGDVGALVDAAERLLRDPDGMAATSAAARRTAAARTWDSAAGTLLSFLDGLRALPPRARRAGASRP
jgi:glycosyltransferase involved in cell wall biosynthesis